MAINTPFKIGTFHVDWDGKVYGRQQGKTYNNWSISTGGSAYFGSLSTGSLKCDNLTCSNTINGTAEYVTIYDNG